MYSVQCTMDYAKLHFHFTFALYFSALHFFKFNDARFFKLSADK